MTPLTPNRQVQQEWGKIMMRAQILGGLADDDTNEEWL
jgi:hypothetical protein